MKIYKLNHKLDSIDIASVKREKYFKIWLEHWDSHFITLCIVLLFNNIREALIDYDSMKKYDNFCTKYTFLYVIIKSND
jgi:hypothetical protein